MSIVGLGDCNRVVAIRGCRVDDDVRVAEESGRFNGHAAACTADSNGLVATARKEVDTFLNRQYVISAGKCKSRGCHAGDVDRLQLIECDRSIRAAADIDDDLSVARSGNVRRIGGRVVSAVTRDDQTVAVCATVDCEVDAEVTIAKVDLEHVIAVIAVDR